MSIVTNTGRTKVVNLSAGVVKEISVEVVYEGKNLVVPNVFQIRNMNTVDIVYMDSNSDVGTGKFILSIDKLTYQRYLAGTTINRLYFLSISDCDIELYSAYDPQPNVSDINATQTTNIVNTSLTVASLSLGASSANIGDVDVLSLPALPAGTNNIGDVDVASLPAIPAGTNNIGDVDVASLPALATGNNVIGKAKITDGTNDLVVEADGSINVNGATFTGTIGTVKLEDSTGTYILDIDSDGYLTVKLSGAIPAGDNNIGNIDVVTIPDAQINKPATTPTIYNVTCTTLNTEYSQALTANTKKFVIGIQSKDDTVTWKLKFGTGGIAFNFNGSETYECNDLLLAGQTLYFESNKSGEVIQIIEVV